MPRNTQFIIFMCILLCYGVTMALQWKTKLLLACMYGNVNRRIPNLVYTGQPLVLIEAEDELDCFGFLCYVDCQHLTIH